MLEYFCHIHAYVQGRQGKATTHDTRCNFQAAQFASLKNTLDVVSTYILTLELFQISISLTKQGCS